jgi:hypothetical protein
LAIVPQRAVRRSVCATSQLAHQVYCGNAHSWEHVLRLVLCPVLSVACRRVPQPFNDHSRFSFAAPGELTSIQVNTPTYQLPELPAPDRPLLVPKQQQSAALPLLVS